MIHQRDLCQLSKAGDLLGDLDILSRRARVSTGVIMRDNKGNRILGAGKSNQISRVGQAAISSSPEEHLKVNDFQS